MTMTRSHGWMALLMLTLVLAGNVFAADGPAEPYPTPEGFGQAKKSDEEYVQAAQKFLKDNPQSPYGARVLMDLFMYASIGGNPQQAENLRRMLIFGSNHRLQGAFLLKQYAGQPEALRTFMTPYVSPRLPAVEPPLVAGLHRLLRSAARMVGTAFLEDRDFMLSCAAVTDAMGDKEFRDALVKRLREIVDAKSPAKPTLDACFKDDATGMDKVVALDSLLDFPPARYIQKVYLATLPEDQKAKPAVQQIQTRLLLEQGRFGDALKIIDVMLAAEPSSPDKPQRLFWKGWSLASLGRIPDATAVLNQIGQDPKGSAW
ncbi:MAG: tetratricopeptide repeat protein, partial [Phycisphaeraceae bacterium]|nr:tetratricopeptide repeat protein [Phycisphaeraceae bacterium]